MSALLTEKVAKSFRRLGWWGFLIQLVLAVIPIAVLAYILSGRVSGIRAAFGFGDYLAFAALGVLFFTTLWSYRYFLLGRRMSDPARRPPKATLARTLWIGVWASGIGIGLSLLLLFYEVVRLLLLFLKAPQGGVPVFRTEASDRAAWVSAFDAVSLLAELCTLAGELLIVGLTLWLLFRVFQLADDYDQPHAA